MTQETTNTFAERSVFPSRALARRSLAEKVATAESAVSSSAADQWDSPPMAFMWYHGRRLVDSLSLTRGQCVMDLYCGTGAVSIPAAQQVGREGRVLGIDGGARLIARARARASWLALPQAQFQVGDFESTTLPIDGFDAVSCAFGLAQAPDPVAAVRMMWSQVRPGGDFGIAMFAHGLFGPAGDLFMRSLSQEHPDVAVACQRLGTFGTEETLTGLLQACGVNSFRTSREPYEQALRTPEDWWSIISSSLYRNVLDAVDADTLSRIRSGQIRGIEEAQIHSVRTDALFAIARKPAPR